ENTASALRELHNALLVGSPSAGAMLVSRYVRLSDGYELQIPISDYVSIKGDRLEGHRLEPDLEIPGVSGGTRGATGNGVAADDPAPMEAVKLLRQQSAAIHN